MKGSYILLIELPQPREISVGKLGLLAFPQGFYAYVGSAMNGFEGRIGRHLQRKKKLHWHIDYLLEQASIREITLFETEERAECILAQTLSKEFPSVPGFGSSDCRCRSHLYFEDEKGKLEEGIIEAIKFLARGRLVSLRGTESLRGAEATKQTRSFLALLGTSSAISGQARNRLCHLKNHYEIASPDKSGSQ